MASQHGIHDRGSSTDEFGYRPRPEFRPVLCQSRYFVSAYLRAVVALLAILGIYVVAVGRYLAAETELRRGIHEPAPTDPIPVEEIRMSVNSVYPLFDVDGGLFTGYLGAVASVFTWWPVLAALTLGLLLVLALERRS